MKQRALTILAVDDDANDQVLLARAFKCAQIEITLHQVSSAEEAIEYLEGRGTYSDHSLYPYPSLLITDLKMFPTDGFSVLGHLRNIPERAIIPTVVLSASPDANDIRKAYRLGASAYLTKPHSNAELTRLVGTLLEFWALCEVPRTDGSGKWVETGGAGKLGAKFDT
jgi:CheY-like chemotaxis protein